MMIQCNFDLIHGTSVKHLDTCVLLPDVPETGEEFALNGVVYVVEKRQYSTNTEQDNIQLYCTVTLRNATVPSPMGEGKIVEEEEVTEEPDVKVVKKKKRPPKKVVKKKSNTTEAERQVRDNEILLVAFNDLSDNYRKNGGLNYIVDNMREVGVSVLELHDAWERSVENEEANEEFFGDLINEEKKPLLAKDITKEEDSLVNALRFLNSGDRGPTYKKACMFEVTETLKKSGVQAFFSTEEIRGHLQGIDAKEDNAREKAKDVKFFYIFTGPQEAAWQCVTQYKSVPDINGWDGQVDRLLGRLKEKYPNAVYLGQYDVYQGTPDELAEKNGIKKQIPAEEDKSKQYIYLYRHTDSESLPYPFRAEPPLGGIWSDETKFLEILKESYSQYTYLGEFEKHQGPADELGKKMEACAPRYFYVYKKDINYNGWHSEPSLVGIDESWANPDNLFKEIQNKYPDAKFLGKFDKHKGSAFEMAAELAAHVAIHAEDPTHYYIYKTDYDRYRAEPDQEQEDWWGKEVNLYNHLKKKYPNAKYLGTFQKHMGTADVVAAAHADDPTHYYIYDKIDPNHVCLYPNWVVEPSSPNDGWWPDSKVVVKHLKEKWPNAVYLGQYSHFYGTADELALRTNVSQCFPKYPKKYAYLWGQITGVFKDYPFFAEPHHYGAWSSVQKFIDYLKEFHPDVIYLGCRSKHQGTAEELAATLKLPLIDQMNKEIDDEVMADLKAKTKVVEMSKLHPANFYIYRKDLTDICYASEPKFVGIEEGGSNPQVLLNAIKERYPNTRHLGTFDLHRGSADDMAGRMKLEGKKPDHICFLYLRSREQIEQHGSKLLPYGSMPPCGLFATEEDFKKFLLKNHKGTYYLGIKDNIDSPNVIYDKDPRGEFITNYTSAVKARQI